MVDEMIDVNDSELKEPKLHRERLLPVFVVEIISNNTSKSRHCSQKFICDRLKEEPYRINVSSKTISRCLSSLLDEEFGIWGSSKEGYWYEKKSYCQGLLS